MRSMKGERGAITMGLVVAIFIALFAAYEAKQFGPILLRQFQFQDFAMEAAKFGVSKDANAIASEIASKAAELRLPITKEMVKVAKSGTHVRIQTVYELSVEWLPGKPYKWKVTVDEESQIF